MNGPLSLDERGATSSQRHTLDAQRRKRIFRKIFFLVVILLAVGLRVFRLETDAYPGLSWDTGLFTDEGFYLHNARNVLLFGKLYTDEFNNFYLMPLLHLLQLMWFRCFGVGSLQTRLFSVTLSLLTMPLYFDALQRLFSRRVAMLATLFLALDHLNLLYNRMGLMDTPAAFAMVATLWAFSRARTESGRKRTGFAFLCGVMGGTLYVLRSLALAVIPAFFLSFGRSVEEKERKTGQMRYFIIGLFFVSSIVFMVWYFPNHAEISRINTFHLKEQLLPKTVRQLGLNLWQAIGGIRYLGLLPYLLIHSPVVLIFTLIGLVKPFVKQMEGSESSATRLFRLWILAFWVLFAISNYAPSRYYVLFYPAMMALAAHQLIAFCDRYFSQNWKTGRIMLFFLVIWGIVNGCWIAHWLFTLKTTRRDAETWLVRNLPPDTVLIGDCAPGLALDSHFLTVNVQPGLCNDRDTLKIFKNKPCVILILDGVWKEKWWTENYPEAILAKHRIALFQPLISHTVGVYRVESQSKAGKDRSEVERKSNAGR